jgi:hypothetical protein
MLRAAYAAVYVIAWFPGVSEAWNKGVICERSPKLAIANSLAAIDSVIKLEGCHLDFATFGFS